ncbi:MAG: dipeptide epimerase [Gammaproteobacteria bacterium]|nr:dipeptide epimerase [Gammaproteobacteria bacterium]
MTGPVIVQLQVRPLQVLLKSPFVIASASIGGIDNLAVRIELEDGAVGWGEVAILPPLTAEDTATAARLLAGAADMVAGQPVGEWRELARALRYRFEPYAATRAGVEMALIDAAARSAGMSLYDYFGGASRRLTTDITIPICPPAQAADLAARYRLEGFDTIKTKIGLDIGADVERLLAIRRGFPGCRLVLDANGGYDAQTALQVIAWLRSVDVVPALFEQPVARADWDGLGRVAREAGVPVAADESCRSLEDTRRIARDGLAQVVNIKLAKSGVAEALDIAAFALRKGLLLMIGGMVESRLGMGFSAHLAAGLGAFTWIDLDTPLLLATDPVRGGYRQTGPTLELDCHGVGVGHGGSID